MLANIALSVLDEHFAEAWGTNMATDTLRRRRRRNGEPNYRIIRYADDFVVMVSGTEAHAEELKGEVAAVLAPMGLRLSEEKTTVVHIDKGFDFLGLRIQRRPQRGSGKLLVYSCPSKKALASIMAKVKAITRQGTSKPLADLLRQLNLALRGWTTYFRHGASARTFNYLSHYTWRRVMGWLRHKYLRISWKQLLRRHLGNEWWPAQGGVTLFDPKAVPIVRYRYRGSVSPSPWDEWQTVRAK